METLRFLIKGQMIKKDPACSFNRMVAGSSNYYIAAFEMDDAWTGYSCVAKFNADGKLISIIDCEGKSISLTHTDRQSVVTDVYHQHGSKQQQKPAVLLFYRAAVADQQTKGQNCRDPVDHRQAGGFAPGGVTSAQKQENQRRYGKGL